MHQEWKSCFNIKILPPSFPRMMISQCQREYLPPLLIHRREVAEKAADFYLLIIISLLQMTDITVLFLLSSAGRDKITWFLPCVFLKNMKDSWWIKATLVKTPEKWYQLFHTKKEYKIREKETRWGIMTKKYFYPTWNPKDVSISIFNWYSSTLSWQLFVNTLDKQKGNISLMSWNELVFGRHANEKNKLEQPFYWYRSRARSKQQKQTKSNK